MKKLLTTLLAVFMVVTIGTVNVFGEGNVVAKIGDNEYSSIPEAISASKSGDVIDIVKEGTYAIPSPIDGVTIDGNLAGGKEKVIFDISYGAGQLASTSGEVGFENCTFIFGNNGYTGFQHPGAINFTNCNINGYFQSYGTMNFTDCVFSQTNNNYSMWCYSGDVTYTRCTFNEAKAALNLYNEGNNSKDAAGNVIPWVVTVEDCDFVYTGVGDNSYAGILLKTIVADVSDARCKNMGYKLVLKGTNTASSNWKGTKESGYGQNPSTSKLVGLVDGLVWVQQAESDISSIVENGTQVWPKVLEPVAQIGDTKYLSLKEALKDVPDDWTNPTIEILEDIDDAEGIEIEEYKRCTIDFNGHTYTIKKAGSDTASEGFIINENAVIAFKDGTIMLDSNNDSISTVIKDCGDMMLDNMRIIGINVVDGAGSERVITNKCGNIYITAGTSIIAKNGDIALDSCKDNAFDHNAQVTIDNANIAGNIEVDGGILYFKDGKILGKIYETNTAGKLTEVANGLFSDVVDDNLIAEGRACVANEDSNTNLAYPYTIGLKADLNVETGAKQIVEEPKINTNIPETDKEVAEAVSTAIESTSIDLMPEAKTLANDPNVITEAIQEKAISNNVKQDLGVSSDDEVKIVVEAKLKQEVTSVEKQENELVKFKVDITPVYEIKAVNVNDETKTVVLSSETPKIEVDRIINIKLYLPADFVGDDDVDRTNIYVKHHGNVYGNDGGIVVKKEADSGKFYIEFLNPDGFSVFEFSKVELIPDPKPTPVSPTTGYIIPKTGVK